MKYLLTVMFAVRLLFQSCYFDDTPFSYLMIYNRSDKDIYAISAWDNDTIDCNILGHFMNSPDTYRIAAHGNDYYYAMGHDYMVPDSHGSYMHIYLYDAEIVEKFIERYNNGEDLSMLEKQMRKEAFLQKYDLSYEEIEKSNWKFYYPQ